MVGDYVIAYRVDGENVLILRVLRGSRDIEALFRDWLGVVQSEHARHSTTFWTHVCHRARPRSGHQIAGHPAHDLRAF